MKKVLIVLLFCVALLLLASCGGKGGKTTTAPATTEAPTTTADPATTAAPATTVAPASTAPTTTETPATTEAPATTAVSTAAPSTTEAPSTTAPPATTELQLTASPDGKVTVYGDGVVPAIIVSASIPSSAQDTVMALRTLIKTRVGSSPEYKTDVKKRTGVEIVFGDTNRAITERAKASLPAFVESEDTATFVVYFDADGVAVVWNHEYGAMVGARYFSDEYCKKTTLKTEVGTTYVGSVSVSEYAEVLRLEEEERIRREEEEHQARVEQLFATRFNVIEDATVRAAVKDFYEEFYDPEKIIRWWAGLYDPDLGGFYYANSARDNAGYGTNRFLPDMESTWQIVQRLRFFDKNADLARFLGPDISAKMIKFFQDMQDPEDGYFYHPQWTKAQSQANVMRYTRDQDWAIAALENLHAQPLYPTALDRAKGAASSSVLSVRRLASPVGITPVKAAGWTPTAGQSKEDSVKAYVNDLLDTTSCEHWSNQLDTQISTFEAYGVLDAVIDVLDERVNPEYGLWVRGYNASSDLYYNMKTTLTTETPYGIFTNTYKVMKCYNAAGRSFAYASKMVVNAFKAINLRDPGARVTYIFNPWATLAQVRSNLKNYGTEDGLAEYYALINENFAEILDSLKATLGEYRWEDGSYSFLTSGSSPTIYSTPVSLGLEEGDVNATNLVLSLSSHICSALGLSETIAVFNENHGKLMQELLNNAEPVPKAGDPAAEASVVCNFNSDKVNSLPGGATQNKKDGTTFSVIEEPGNTSNKVVQINKNTEDDTNGGQLMIPLLPVEEMTDDTVLELGMRINVTGETRFGNEISNQNNPNIIQIGFMCQDLDNMFWMPTLRFNNDGYTLLTVQSTSGGTTEYPDNKAKTFQFDTWYEFTFRLTIKNFGKSNAQFSVEILVDGEPFGTSQNFYSDSIAFRTGKTIRVRFQPQMRIHALIYVDDISATVKTVEP